MGRLKKYIRWFSRDHMSSLDILKDNTKDNYLISKFNYLVFYLITISFFTNFLNNCFFLVVIFIPFPYPLTWI
jgi:hypothetical protein